VHLAPGTVTLALIATDVTAFDIDPIRKIVSGPAP
jgi:hypothetical protein